MSMVRCAFNPAICAAVGGKHPHVIAKQLSGRGAGWLVGTTSRGGSLEDVMGASSSPCTKQRIVDITYLARQTRQRWSSWMALASPQRLSSALMASTAGCGPPDMQCRLTPASLQFVGPGFSEVCWSHTHAPAGMWACNQVGAAQVGASLKIAKSEYAGYCAFRCGGTASCLCLSALEQCCTRCG